MAAESSGSGLGFAGGGTARGRGQRGQHVKAGGQLLGSPSQGAGGLGQSLGLLRGGLPLLEVRVRSSVIDPRPHIDAAERIRETCAMPGDFLQHRRDLPGGEHARRLLRRLRLRPQRRGTGENRQCAQCGCHDFNLSCGGHAGPCTAEGWHRRNHRDRCAITLSSGVAESAGDWQGLGRAAHNWLARAIFSSEASA